MKPNALPLFIVTLFLGQTTLLSSQNWTAAERFSSSSNSLLTSTSTALGSDGSLYIVGNFQNMVCFDTIILNAPSANRTNGFLLKLDAQMQPVWARQFPEYPYDVTLDAQDNVFIAGSRWNAVGSDDTLTYVSKHNSDGALLATFYSTGTSQNWGKVVRTDAAGNCYVAGERASSGTATFGSNSLPGGSGRQCYLLKLSPDLTQVDWVTFTGSSPNLDNVFDLEIDNTNGFIYASGNYSQCPGFFCIEYNGDFYIEKHQLNNGATVWRKLFSGGSGRNTKQFSRLSPDGQTLAVAACFKYTTTFEPGLSLTAVPPNNDDYHVFVAEISAGDASVHWAKKITLSGDAFLWRMARSGNELWLSGFYTKAMDVPPFSLTNNSADAFLFKVLAQDGTVVEAEKQHGSSSDSGFGLAQRDSIVAISGESSSATLTIGGGAFVLPGNFNSTFVARKGGLPQLPPIAGFEASLNGGCVPLSVQFTNTSYQSATTYNWQFQGGTPSTSTAKNPSVTYNTPGTYNVTLRVRNGGGADTLVQLGYITVSASNITSAFSSSANGLTANFNNTSTNAETYLWDFGDGNTSIEASPEHSYTNCGTYTVTLTSTNLCGTASSTETVTLGNGNPSAGITATMNGLTANFGNTSTNADTYLWDFGDGNTSIEANPEHTYTACGTYTVTLTSTNFCGTASSTETLTFGNGIPSAGLTTTINGLTANFDNTSTNADTYLWDFGDGNTSIEASPEHTYTNCGTYTVTLTSTNLCGTASSTETLTFGNGIPTAGITATLNGLTANFNNTSTNADTYLWDFGDGNTSIEANPEHTYTDCGTYTVTLTSTNLCGTASSTETVSLGNGNPTAGITATLNGLMANFDNTSTNADTYLWDFGDGNTSSEANPEHTYTDCGTYTVTLTSTNLCGTASSTETLTFGNGIPTAGITATLNGLTANFNNTSTNADTYLWDFGDGNTSIEANPEHTYTDCGTYTVTLTSTNLCGTASSTETVSLGNGNPTAGITATLNGLMANFDNTSTNADTYLWDFGDGNTSSEANPEHTYTDCGTYTVTLTSTNLCGTASSTAIAETEVLMPSASFMVIVNSLSVIFQNTSSGGSSYFWDFGDGQTSSLQNPLQQVYADTGVYIVTLIVGNICGTDTFQQTIVTTACLPPEADFVAEQLEVCAGELVQFASLSTNFNTLLWTFPGANQTNSGDTVTAVSYALPGLYSVVLNAINECGNAQEIKLDYILVHPSPTIGFNVNIFGLTVEFGNLSQDALSYWWDFGDGQTSTEVNPMHTYSANGTYTVSLTAGNDCDTLVFSKTITVTTVGTNSPTGISEFRLLPNPNAGLFLVEMKGTWHETLSIRMLNSTGQLVHSMLFDVPTGFFAHTFDLRDVPSGLYWMHIRSGREIWAQKVVVTR